MENELEHLFDQLLDEEFDFTIKHNLRVWSVSYEITDYIYDTKRNVFGRCVKPPNGNNISVIFENGITAEIDIAHYLGRKEMFFVSPLGNTALNYLKNQRGVNHLIHFTPLVNLPEIIEKGICPRSLINENALVTDRVRLDENIDATSFSISFPNYKMLSDKRFRTMKDTTFIILVIDIDALLSVEKKDIAYCSHNAGSWSMQQTDFFQKSLLCSAADMFADTNDQMRKKYYLPSYYTTDPQAEIQIRDIISASFIKEIHVENSKVYEAVCNLGIENLPPVKQDKTYFSPRQDYEYWR